MNKRTIATALVGILVAMLPYAREYYWGGCSRSAVVCQLLPAVPAVLLAVGIARSRARFSYKLFMIFLALIALLPFLETEFVFLLWWMGGFAP
jgi:hypothetical protein